MPADKNIGGCASQLGLHVWIIARWIAADVRDPNLKSFQLEMLVFRCKAADGLPVDVARHGTQWFKSRQSLENSSISDISGVPNFVTIIKMLENGFIQKAMSI